ncbi:hypothetical protein GG344DRAFT_75715 [Lentinula edodes]|nr:hypothetical protein GG344DRAFT_75715 [Lentinula edodes]
MPPPTGFQLRTNVDFASVRQKLRSEYGATIQSDGELSQSIAEIDKDLEACSIEIHHLQSGVIFLQNQHRRLENYRTCLRSLKSPIRKLPNEVMLRIFDYACDMNDVFANNIEAMPASSISSVCARWRNLAKSQSILWSRIRIKMEKVTANFPIFNLYLGLSQNSPLDIVITGKWPKNSLKLYHFELCHALAARTNLWRVFRVQRAETSFLLYQIFVEGEQPQFQLLEDLALPENIVNHQPILKHYENAPALRSLNIRTLSPIDSIPSSHFPWRKIITFNSAHFPDSVETLFNLCRDLKELHLGEVHKIPSHPCPSPVTVSSLEKLSLTLNRTQPDPESLANIVFSSLTCPSLTSLSLEDTSGYGRPFLMENLHTFISRSSFHLATLSIKFISFSDLNLIDLLCCLPSLLHIILSDPVSVQDCDHPITPRLLKRMHAYPCMNPATVSPVLVPNMQSLSLTCTGSAGFSDKDFTDMVSSRWSPNSYFAAYGMETSDDPFSKSEGETACLRSVVLRFTNRVVDMELYRPLKHLEEAGMKVVVTGKMVKANSIVD